MFFKRDEVIIFQKIASFMIMKKYFTNTIYYSSVQWLQYTKNNMYSNVVRPVYWFLSWC